MQLLFAIEINKHLLAICCDTVSRSGLGNGDLKIA